MGILHPIKTEIVLLGAGHAHVEVLRRFAVLPEPGVCLTLIAREPETPYSGMLPGVIRGEYSRLQAQIDLAPLAALAGARLIAGEATRIDPDNRTLSVTGRPDIGFDLLSIDIGGIPAVPSGSGIGVKPIGRFLDHLEMLEQQWPDGSRIAIVGAGAAGSELALALAVRFAEKFRLVLVSAGPEPVPEAPASARRAVRLALADNGVELVCGVTASALDAGQLRLSDGTHLDVATALWATGVEGPAFLAESGLACDRIGCIRVTRTLASVSHPHVFAAGDCAAMDKRTRPKAGVWAVRAGPPLAENLRRAATGRKLQTWRPQRRALTVLGLGGGKAVAWRNGLSLKGRTAQWLKDRIDRRWMRQYSELKQPAGDTAALRGTAVDAKIGAVGLANALSGLRPGGGLMPGTADIMGMREDAAVLQPPLGKLLVQSVDFLPLVLDDPFVFGQIAAAHALSDLHAMGAKPWTALAFAAVVNGQPDRPQADVSAMMQGASETFRRDGCSLVGGHTAVSAEPGLGFSVTGLVESGKLLRKSGLRPGDRLILTKAVGSGLILAGHRLGHVRAQWLLAAIESMRATNAAAARIFMAHEAAAGTDVSGFGLAGHLMDMMGASGVSAVLRVEAVPLLPGAKALLAHGIENRLAADNLRLLGDAASRPEARLLADPQVSGGLLVGLSEGRAEACLAALIDLGLTAAIIGEVEVAPGGRPRMRLE